MACPKFSVTKDAEESLQTLRNSQRGSWKSISIGHHPFLGNAFDKIHEGQARDWHHWLGHCDFDEILSTEELRLSVVSNGWQENSVVHAQLGFGINMMSKLRELELKFDNMRAEDAFGERESYDRVITFDRRQYDSWHNLWIKGSHPHLVFRNLLAAKGHEFTSLKVLTLRDFTFEQDAMHDFLVSLKKLHTLHLIDCLSLGTYDGLFTMARTELPPSLRLAGVEIYGLRFIEIDHQVEPRPAFDPELREKTTFRMATTWEDAILASLITNVVGRSKRSSEAKPGRPMEIGHAITSLRHSGDCQICSTLFIRTIAPLRTMEKATRICVDVCSATQFAPNG